MLGYCSCVGSLKYFVLAWEGRTGKGIDGIESNFVVAKKG